MTLLHSNTTNIVLSISPWSLCIIPVTHSTPLDQTCVLVTCLELLLLLQSSSISQCIYVTLNCVSLTMNRFLRCMYTPQSD